MSLARFVREAVVHYGNRVNIVDGSHVSLLCDRVRLFAALYGGPGRAQPPLYELGVEVFPVLDDVDCMTCLVVEARKR